MKKVFFALSALALTSTSVFAADAGDGTIKFTGEIVDAACVVSPDSQKQEVVLGQVNKSVFTATGDKSPATPFKIKLENCDISSTAKNVEISFSGVGAAGNEALVSVSTEPGAATGVGIGIYDNTNTLVDLNTGKSATLLKDGQTVLYFTANYVSISDVVTTGYGNAEVDFNLTYN
ncbi:long polar fimbrial major subunit LpfA [Escherichia coli]|uniref:long polar fimbrial major subunit LpfA n=1 Tax=Escherichia coli TaxID=562 RepID=UPI00148E9891|nr:long polar fimbrial major subunit LpfA [Escherichia coli]QJU26444.1 long polar fimbrial major subunit LpfA [Escherichia coli]